MCAQTGQTESQTHSDYCPDLSAQTFLFVVSELWHCAPVSSVSRSAALNPCRPKRENKPQEKIELSLLSSRLWGLKGDSFPSMLNIIKPKALKHKSHFKVNTHFLNAGMLQNYSLFYFFIFKAKIRLLKAAPLYFPGSLGSCSWSSKVNTHHP